MLIKIATDKTVSDAAAMNCMTAQRLMSAHPDSELSGEEETLKCREVLAHYEHLTRKPA